MSTSRTYVVTGAASGIGAATTDHLRDGGHRVITVDRQEADVVADLATTEGRAAVVAAVEREAELVHGVVPCAGLAGLTGVDPALLVSVNHFGAVSLVEGLQPRLAAAAERDGDAGVVLLSSNSVTCQPGWATTVAKACLAGDEDRARRLAAGYDPVFVYPATKASLAWWARREGVRRYWAGAGVRLNAVAPGLIATAMTDQLGEDERLGRFATRYPTALRRPGRPEEVAAAISFLLSPAASLAVGSVLVLDGGTDAIKHPRSPRGLPLPKPALSAMSRLIDLGARRSR